MQSKFKYDRGKNKYCNSFQAFQVGFLETLVEYFVSYWYLSLPTWCFPSHCTYNLIIRLWSYYTLMDEHKRFVAGTFIFILIYVKD